MPGFVQDFADRICTVLFDNDEEIKNKLCTVYFDCLKVVHFKIKYKWITKLVTKAHGFSHNLTVTHFLWESVQPLEHKKSFKNLKEKIAKLQITLHKRYVQTHIIKDVNFTTCKNELKEENCAICLQPFHCETNVTRKRKRSDNPAVSLACGHILHRDCALNLSNCEFFKTNEQRSLGKCPLCRTQLS